ncbi:hypothetical protein GMD78_11130 [Ornithinibacillus sp. L9]|uniref:Uncharacterized protein n=1 Tax=Ornithinibacillus caprae TaxID=2678566 RepID=A0A6N8FLT1_9BACI|nr:hypothetical protein [Ornithinibacillus caprae]MUK88947.1 hypothetical protein [Ornithinibacillus caprae]
MPNHTNNRNTDQKKKQKSINQDAEFSNEFDTSESKRLDEEKGRQIRADLWKF